MARSWRRCSLLLVLLLLGLLWSGGISCQHRPYCLQFLDLKVHQPGQASLNFCSSLPILLAWLQSTKMASANVSPNLSCSVTGNLSLTPGCCLKTLPKASLTWLYLKSKVGETLHNIWSRGTWSAKAEPLTPWAASRCLYWPKLKAAASPTFFTWLRKVSTRCSWSISGTLALLGPPFPITLWASNPAWSLDCFSLQQKSNLYSQKAFQPSPTKRLCTHKAFQP